MRGLNLDHLRAFAGVVELGSFSAAAARLDISQPAVSLQIRALERRFGVKLIERVGRRALPTIAGQELLNHVREVETALEAASQAMQPHASNVVGRVRIGTGATACIYLLPPILRAVREEFPALEIVVSTGNSPDMLRAIEENRIDLGLLTLPAPGRIFDVRPVLEDEFVVIAPTDGAALPKALTPAELVKHPLVLYEPGANTRRIIDDWFTRAGVTPKPIMQLGSVEAIKELVGAGLGCGVLPRTSLRPKQPGLVVRPLRPRLSRKLALVMRRDKPLTRGLRVLVKAIMTLRK